MSFTSSPDDGPEALRALITAWLERWRASAPPSREQLLAAADRVTAWRTEQGLDGLWPDPPLMLTATLDDGFGHGMEVIHRFAAAAGLRVVHLGALLTPAAVVHGCRRYRPGLLGLTVLRFETEPDLAFIRERIDMTTRMVAGGPVLSADPDLAARAGIDFVARDATDFWRYLLTLGKPNGAGCALRARDFFRPCDAAVQLARERSGDEV